MRLEAVTGRRTGLETVSRSCFTAESPAGNPATRCLVHGPEALRHCLATVLPIAVFRRYMPRLVTIVDYKRGRVNRDTTNGPVRPTSGLSCGSQHHHQGARVDGRCRRRREFVLSVKRVRDKRQDSETSRFQWSWHSQPGYSADLRYWTRWQLPKFRQVPTSVHVAWTPSRVQLQPNCPHHACWLLAIWRYASDVVLTRIPDVAQADNSAQRITVASNPLFAFMMVTFLIKMNLKTLALDRKSVV